MTAGLSSNGVKPAGGRPLTSIAAFRQLRDRPVVRVDVPEFKEHPDDVDEPMPFVYMRAMSDAEKEDWQYRNIRDLPYEPDTEKARERDRQRTYGEIVHRSRVDLISMCVVDEDGQRVFTPDDIDELAEHNAAGIERLNRKARELCGLDLPATTPEAAAKNSAGGPAAASSSTSASPSAEQTPTNSTST